MKTEKKLAGTLDSLAVSQVQVFPLELGDNTDSIKGTASVVLNDQLLINGLRIVEGTNGFFVEFPSDSFCNGEKKGCWLAPLPMLFVIISRNAFWRNTSWCPENDNRL